MHAGQRICRSLVVTIVDDGTKLKPFFVFWGATGGPVDRSFHTKNIFGCCQRNGWFDEVVGRKWVEDIVKQNV
jgi:hypothetical protein